MNRLHRLKTWNKYYEALLRGEKTFEIRLNDRDFKVGDILILQEYNQEIKQYTNREIHKAVTYITDFKQEESYIVMGLSKEFLNG